MIIKDIGHVHVIHLNMLFIFTKLHYNKKEKCLEINLIDYHDPIGIMYLVFLNFFENCDEKFNNMTSNENAYDI